MSDVQDKITKDLANNLGEVVERLDTTVAQLFQKSQAYCTAVMTVGYASFFAIWAFSKTYLPETTTIHVALAMGLSILLFVAFVIIDMFFQTVLLLKANANLRHKYEATTLEGLLAESTLHKVKTEESLASLNETRSP